MDAGASGGEYAKLDAPQQPPPHYGACPPAAPGVRVRIARIGELPHDGAAKLSRDGSPHVTDEVFNTASHFVAAMLSLLGGAELITKASEQAQPWKIVGFSIYSFTLTSLFVCSMLHHGLEGPPLMERGLRIADYCAIYPLIAGTFTPICLVFLYNSGEGWALLGTLWFLTAAGIGLTISAFDHLPKWVPFTMFITMGWMGALLAIAILPFVGVGGIALVALGGVAYSAGGYVYQAETPNPIPGRFGFHEIWHLAVMVGALCHYIFMWVYVLPAASPVA